MNSLPEAATAVWNRAVQAAYLFAVDPAGIGGVSLRASAGPVRDRWLALLRDALPEGVPVRRLPVSLEDGRLLGGLDLAATLRAGQPVLQRGILADSDGGIALLAMAERLTAATCGRLTAVLDAGEVAVARDGFERRLDARLGLVALDEGMSEEERPPLALTDRLALHVDLGIVGWRDAAALEGCSRETIVAARRMLPRVVMSDDLAEAFCITAAALGIDSLRAPLLAVAVARAAAALAGRGEVSPDDAALASRLVLAPRATVLPAASPAPPADEQDASDQRTDAAPQGQSSADEQDREAASADPGLQEMVLEAAQAAIPAGLLAQIAAGGRSRAKAQAQGRAGPTQSGGRRGRPAGIVAGEPRGGLRLSVVDTLRAAAPWQRIRRPEPGQAPRLAIRRQDFRVLRIKQRAETTTIFVVDASGSSALNRLAEAKGAVELVLAECYVRRDRVALVAFRGTGAQILLPPTRSLARAKRSLSSLPGGGGTPLAAGLEAGFALADSVRRKGGMPTLLILTDGGANVARDGMASRQRAEQDATEAARRFAATRVATLLVDVSPRPHPAAQRLATAMGARYLALPYANAAVLSQAVRDAVRPDAA